MWLLLAALPVFLVALGANTIWDANEAFYVETPRQMVLTGDYVNPSFNAAPRFNKPVLSYWIVAGLYRVFGGSVTVERAGIAAGALGIILATFLIGRALRSPPTGWLAALMVASAPRVVMFARRIFIDVYLTLFTSLALALFVLAERHPAHRRRCLALVYVAMGLGVLTKGPVALVLPALAVCLWLTAERRLRDLRRLMLLPGLLIVLAIVVPWYAAVWAQHGWTHITQFFVGENLERYTTAMTPENREVGFYLPVLLGDLFPWSPLVVVPLVGIVARWRAGRTSTSLDSDPAASSLLRLLWLWIVVFVGAFTFSQTKQDLYILPIVPAVAVLVAHTLVRTAYGDRSRAVRAVQLTVALACVAAAAGAYWLFAVPAAGPYRLPGAAAFSSVLALTGAVAGAAWLARRGRAGVVALAGGFVVLNYLFVLAVLPGVERLKPAAPLGRIVAERASSDAQVFYYGPALPSFVYYSAHPMREIGSVEEGFVWLNSRPDVWILTGEREFEAMRATAPFICVAGRHANLDTKLRALMAREPPPEVVLVTNRCGQR